MPAACHVCHAVPLCALGGGGLAAAQAALNVCSACSEIVLSSWVFLALNSSGPEALMWFLTDRSNDPLYHMRFGRIALMALAAV